jgi:hypothetical protein
MNRHLTSGDLLLYVDGELSFWRSRQIRFHLVSCWKCRRELERLQQDIGAIVDAQNRCFLPSTPPPARPWDSFEQLAMSLPASRFRLGRWLRAGNPSLRWATAAVTLVCVLVATLWLAPERLSAAVVLDRMEQAERARTSVNASHVIRQRLRIEQIDRHSSTRHSVEMESWNAGARGVWRGDVGELEKRYRRLGLESALALSPAASERWLRETQAEPKVSRNGDEVELEARDARQGDDLESVHLRVRRGTWRLEGIRLTFADSIFDIAELDIAVLKKNELSSDLLAALYPSDAPEVPRVRPSLPNARPTLDATPAKLLDEELHVQYRLHQIGADLSEPIELKRDHGTILIDARAASDQRKRELAEMFVGNPQVRVETEIDSGSVQGQVSPLVIENSTAQRGQDKRLIEFFGSSEAQENFTRAVLDSDASILAHLYALRSLAQHWPSNVEPTLSVKSRAELGAMVNDHLRVLSRSQLELSRLLAPFLERFCGPSAIALEKSPSRADWRQSITSGLEAARMVDRNLRALLTTSSNDKTFAEACPDLNSALLAFSSSLSNLPPAQ